MRKNRSNLAYLVAFTVLPCIGACAGKPTPVDTGRTIEATYQGGVLSAVLPENARVPAILSAAEQTLRSRGYSVASQSATDEQGQLVARPPRSTTYPRVTVAAKRVMSANQVTIEFEPWGDRDTSLSILDGVLTRLGL